MSANSLLVDERETFTSLNDDDETDSTYNSFISRDSQKLRNQYVSALLNIAYNQIDNEDS